jgi:hypothetical protein
MMIANGDKVRNWVKDNDEEALFADGLDDAIIAISRDSLTGKYRVVYDVARIVQVLVNDQGMSEDEAYEHMEFNIIGGYVGEMTPIWAFLPEEN